MPDRTKTRQSIGRSSREKGKRGEREAAKALMARIPGAVIRRSVQYAGRGASGGTGGMADIVGLPGYHIEVKRTERAEPYKWLTQVATDKRPGEIGIVLHRQSHKEWIAFMTLDDLCQLINAAGIVDDQ